MFAGSALFLVFIKMYAAAPEPMITTTPAAAIAIMAVLGPSLPTSSSLLMGEGVGPGTGIGVGLRVLSTVTMLEVSTDAPTPLDTADVNADDERAAVTPEEKSAADE